MSLVPLVAGSDILVDRAGGIAFDAARALVIVAAELRGLPEGTPDVDDLASWGMLPELAELLGQAWWIHVPPTTAAAIEADIRRGIRRLEQVYSNWGYRLVVTDQVLRYVVRAVRSGTYSGGTAVALAWIETACERALVRMIEHASPGATWVLAVDDLVLPVRPKGVWRE